MLWGDVDKVIAVGMLDPNPSQTESNQRNLASITIHTVAAEFKAVDSD
jgi:hypothetical protein